MSFAPVCIIGTLALSLVLGAYGQIVDSVLSSAAPSSAVNPDVGAMDEFAFTDHDQGRFNWIVSATDLPWIGAFRFLPAPNALATVLLSVSDTSGVALAQCIARRGGADENDWTEFVWSLQPDGLHCNVSTFATRIRFPLTAIPRKRYVVRVSAIEGPRCVAGLMVRNQKPTGCPPHFQRIVFVSQGFNCGCPRRTPDAAVGILDPEHRPELEREHHTQTSVPFPRFEPATSGLFDPTTAAPFVDDLTSSHWLSHLSTGSLAEVAAAATELVSIRQSSAEKSTGIPDVNTTEFPLFVWNNSRAISPVNNPNPVRTAGNVVFTSTSRFPPTTAITTTTTTTATTPSTTVITARTTSTRAPTTARSSARLNGHSLPTNWNPPASPTLTSSTVDFLGVASRAESTTGHTSTTPTTATVGGDIASAPNITLTCTETSCENNGTCVVASPSELLCICPPGFNGTYCESPEPCTNNPCQNGGRCEPVQDTFRCDCPPSTSGEFCESLLCENECHNGGVCIVDENDFTKCNCTAGFLGYNCNLLDVCSGAKTPCDAFGPTATCQVVAEHASPVLVNATYRCLCLDANNGQVECASMLSTTLAANMANAITTSPASSTSTMTSTSLTSTTTSPSPATTLTTAGSSSTTTELWSTTTTLLAESSTGVVNAVEESAAHGGAGGAVTIVLVVVGVLVLLLVLFLAALISVRFVRRSRKLHGKYNPAKEESMVGAGLSLPMATINKEERLI